MSIDTRAVLAFDITAPTIAPSVRGRPADPVVRDLADQLVLAAHELRDTATDRERAAMAVSAYNCALRLLRRVADGLPDAA
jgi:hypothetical protein